MATIIDVARRAGVSISTVSHVVNRTRRVKPDTIRLVEEAIAFVGFRPNALARSLKRASTDSVGIAISAISNPYFSDTICAIETECARLGMMVFVSDTQDDPSQAQVPQAPDPLPVESKRDREKLQKKTPDRRAKAHERQARDAAAD